MKINISENLRMEVNIPILWVENFQIEWQVNQHALLVVNGYKKFDVNIDQEKIYKSTIKICQNIQDKDQVLFNGYVTLIEYSIEGKSERFHLEAKSGSFILDQKQEFRSYQNIELTYSEIIKGLVNSKGGQVICTKGRDVKINKPVIQYKETVWEFSKRLASHLESCIIPDIETGGPNIWFGMRKGNIIQPVIENEYNIQVKYKNEIDFEFESSILYKIGDKIIYFGKEMIIYAVSVLFMKGEVIYKYVLKDFNPCKIIYQDQFIGVGLKGFVIDTCKERVRVALDIDKGQSTGTYFYDWYSESGNSFYAVPEIGACIVLYFGSKDEREGYVINSLPFNQKSRGIYEDRYVNIEKEIWIQLFREQIRFFTEGKYSLLLHDDAILVRSVFKINIFAYQNIKIKSKRINVSAPDSINICRGLFDYEK